MDTMLRRIDRAILMADKGQYLEALTQFLEIYGTEDSPPLNSAKAASGLSYFGLCLALVQKKYRAAADLCKRAIGLEFDNGLKIAPENDQLMKVRKELGVRARPTVPFLDRSHPINVSLGQARHAKRTPETREKRS